MSRRRCPFLLSAATLAICIVVPACGGDRGPPPLDLSRADGRPCPGQPDFVEVGTASWYGPQHHGRVTASGGIYDMNKLTAAHRRLPFGTRIIVTNLGNGRSVTLTVTDRGPYIRGRVIDVSRKAADELGFRSDGLARVRITTTAGCV